MDEKKYSVDEVIYNEFYRIKLPFIYYLFSKNALIMSIVTYFIIIELLEKSINFYLTITVFALMIGYKKFFKSYRGDEFNIWIIDLFGKLILNIKKKTQDLNA